MSIQHAALWWRILLNELGTTAHTRTEGLLGEAAKHRVMALVHLFFAVIRGRVKCFLEIGAHNAESSRRFLKENSDGLAHAYEAADAVYRRVMELGLPPGMQMFNCAVGRSDGEVTFFVPTEERLQVWGSMSKRSGNVSTRETTVPMLTLDSAAEKLPVSAGSKDVALWIDVEGAALDVLVGGPKILGDRVAVAFMEVNDFSTYEGSATSIEIIDLLLKHNFIPVARDNQYSDAWNLLVVHADLFSEARDLIVKWTYHHCGFGHVSRLLESGARVDADNS